MKNVTIKRSKWYRGKKSSLFSWSTARLWMNDKKGRGCCLGHVLIQTEGYTKKELCNIADPIELWSITGKRNNLCGPGKFGWDNKDWVKDAMAFNDNELLTDKQREKELKKLFKENGYNVKFVD